MQFFVSTFAEQKITPLEKVKKEHVDGFIATRTGAVSTRIRKREMLKEFWLYFGVSEWIDRHLAYKVIPIDAKRDRTRVG